MLVGDYSMSFFIRKFKVTCAQYDLLPSLETEERKLLIASICGVMLLHFQLTELTGLALFANASKKALR